MLFRDMELDFDIYNAEDAEAYEQAHKNFEKTVNEKSAGETMSESIRRQCGAIFDFFDDVLGEGAHVDICGENTNLRVCIEAFTDFIKAIKMQSADIKSLTADIKAQTAEMNSAAGNREARRAAARALNRAQ